MAEISLQEYYAQIEDMVDQGRYAQAVAHGKHILTRYPKYVAGYRLLGRAMLEARRDDDAFDMFLRVLSANPEDMLSWVALSEIYDRRDELEAAVWCLERAFELSVDNQLVGEELRQLYGRRDGVEPERVELTRGALARLYLKGDLLSRSVSEFRTLLDEQPDRVDLEVAFAEALWRNEQRLEASEVCQSILDKLSYCLKANLLLGEIWVNSGREEGQTYLRRAEALDPQNGIAQMLFGDASPLPARDVRISPLERMPSADEERPAWMVEVEAVSAEGPPLTEGEAALVDIAAALEAQIEIPSWLEEIEVGEAETLPEVPAFMAAMEMEQEEPAEVEEQAPEWLMGAGEEEEFAWGEEMEQEPGAEVIVEEVIEEEYVVSEEVPDWLAGLEAEPLGEEEVPGEEEAIPDFLAEFGAGAFAEEAASSEEEEIPDWLAGLRAQAAEPAGAEEAPGPAAEAPPEPVRAEIPDWMQELAPSAEAFAAEETPVGEMPAGTEMPEAEAPTVGAAEEPVLSEAEEPTPAAAEEEVSPSWLEGEGMPSGEEALAWLEQLASGKEAELQAQVEKEIEARTAEIMGRPKPETPAAEEAPPEPVRAEIPDWMQELAPRAGEISAEEMFETEAFEAEEPVAGEIEAAFGWTAFGEPEAEESALGAAEEPALSGVEEEAFGWTAFGEPEARAFGAEEEAPEVPIPPAEELVLGEVEEFAVGAAEEAPTEVIEEAEAPEMEEAFGWTAFGELEPEWAAPGEAMPEAAPVEEPVVGEVPAPSVVEEVMAEAVSAPAVEEMVPEAVEEIIAPAAEEPQAPPPEAVEPKAAEPKDPFAAPMAYLKENPRDYDARLELARRLWQVDRREESLEAYSRLIRAGRELDVVIEELEEYLEQWSDVSTQRVLGDAYMKNNQLDKALALYRQALESL
jgi:tetratricopeptide (TPR) repeat protein